MVEEIHRSVLHLWLLTSLQTPKHRRKIIGCCRNPFRLSVQCGCLDWLIACSEIDWFCSWFCVTVSMVSSNCAVALNVISCPGICSASGSFLSNFTSARIPEDPYRSFKLNIPDRSVNPEVLQLKLNAPSPCHRKVGTSCWFPDHMGLRFTLILFSHLVQDLSSGALKRGARTRVFYRDIIFSFCLYNPWMARTVT
jgi:hypothetical protein